ncbi:MAG: helicase-related protein, partial [Luteimonas sp.]
EVQIAGRNAVAEMVTHIAHPVDGARKRDLLIDILSARWQEQILVFGKTKHGCNRLAEQLEKAGITAVAIHGNKSQAQRLKALAEFKNGKARVLVATDVAARGLDIPNLPLVINHDLPMVPEDYIHRIGRTGRAGLIGEALSLVSPEEGGLLRLIQRMLKVDLVMDVVEGYAPSKPIRLDTPVPKNGGGQRQDGQRAPGRPGHRPHGRPAPRHAHAGPKQHRSGGQGAYAGRRDTRA